MAFIITEEERAGQSFIILENQDNGESMEIVTSLGGTVNKINLIIKNAPQNILFSDNDDELHTHKLHKGRMLFPFNDLIPDAKYVFKGKEYQLPANPKKNNSISHGFICNKKMDVIGREINNDSCSTTLEVNIKDGDYPGYPFNISLQIKYTLLINEVKIDFFIDNKGNTETPTALGWHPYYTFNNSIDTALLHMPSETYFEIDDRCLPTGNILECKNSEFDFHKPAQFKTIEIDHAFSVPEDGKIILQSNNEVIEIEHEPKIFKYIQLYTPTINNSIAIEPISAAANSFNHEEYGLIIMKPAEKINTFVKIKTYTK